MLFKTGYLAAASCLLANIVAQETTLAERSAIDGLNTAPTHSLVRRKDWESPAYTLLFRTALPIPPVKQPKLILQNPISGKDIWYFELEIKEFLHQVYPNLRPARLVGYDGIGPGPTFIIPVGTETVVRILNSAPRDETSVHLHGSPSRAPFDGWAEDVTYPGQYKDYYFPNYQSARFLWYHDHAFEKTAENAYFGQAGAYILHNPAEDVLGLPSGYGEFDIPLVLTAKYYNRDGTLKSTAGEDSELAGDIIHVNGQPWPFFNVQPRKYRLRFLNAAVSRSWDLYFVRTTALKTRLPFQVIASDAGLLSAPVPATDLYISPGERYEVVIDFSAYAGQSIDIRQVPEANDVSVDDEYLHTDKTMRFVVSSTPVQDPSRVPSTLRQLPVVSATSVQTRHFKFGRSNGQWLINDVGFADVENRVLARPAIGTVETWELENSSGGWSHPVHLHLVDFKVIKRTGGRNRVLPYEANGFKDVVWLGRGETLTIEAHYLPWTGVYMWHCHNLIHEDHDMMAVFNATALTSLGYDETTDFSDPMDPRWRAVPFSRSDFTARTGPFTDAAITAKVNLLAEEEPYSQLDDALEVYGKRDVITSSKPIPRYRRIKI
ncbi:hypothetical protein S40293_06829 [Stachybotrys chartarum IBT 40293]|nr:hypothetical protein S40293_06829 [Stachybotrys chartarum IBT 40293]